MATNAVRKCSICRTEAVLNTMRYHIVASHECLGLAVGVGTWVVVVTVHGKSANQGIY